MHKKITYTIKFVLILCIMLINNSLYSQNEIYSQSRINKFLISPAYSGFNKNTEAFLGYQKQWIGMQGSPESQFVNANTAFRRKSGFGFSILNNSIGNFKNFNANLSLAHKIRLSKYSSLSFGYSLALQNYQMDISKIKSQGNDPVIENLNSLKANFFDIGAGLVYNNKNFYFGISSPYILAFDKKINETNSSFQRKRYLQFHSSYIYKFNENFTFEPLLIANFSNISNFETYNWTVFTNFNYKRKVSLAFAYNNSKQVSMSIGGAATDRIIIDYTYSFGGGIAKNSSGTHEFSIGFLINRNVENLAFDYFPMTEEEKFEQESKQEFANIRADIKKVKQKFNKTIGYYEKRVSELEANQKNASKLANISKDLSEPEILPNIKFATNSAKIFSSSQNELNIIIGNMVENPELKVVISVYTSDTGSSIFMKDLSNKRAETIKKYLLARGIPQRNLMIIGKGGSRNERIEIQYQK